jgi:hypothetical protein
VHERLAAVDHRRSVRVQWEDVLLIMPLNREVRILIGTIHLCWLAGTLALVAFLTA